MNFSDLKANPVISFNYGAQTFQQLIQSAETTVTQGDLKDFKMHQITYLIKDGLKITTNIKEYNHYKAYDIVTCFENTSDSDSKIISNLKDCDVSFDFAPDPQPITQGFSIDTNTAKVVTVEGSNLAHDEFGVKNHYIRAGFSQKYSNIGGRSCHGLAPFFDINQGDRGVLVAVGWSGQWNAEFQRTDTQINLKTGIEAVAFKLYPKEKIRTSSVVLVEYDQGQNHGHNLFRRLVKQSYSIIGQEGRPSVAPLAAMTWGSLPSEKIITRIQKMKEYDLGIEYCWIDAGWYGESTHDCPNEFTGDWVEHTGNWIVNQKYHPKELVDVAECVKQNQMKFLLWIEPERVVKTNIAAKSHPEWYLTVKDQDNVHLILNLGNEDALQHTIQTVSSFIENLGLSCYRQDFNTSPLDFWRENDQPDRKGITEIKHIMGLYQFWDTLLERFPHLIIDNCASGGKRIDIELLKRSMPLWRSDYQCVWDCDAETTQVHNTGISWWLPYSGTGAGFEMGDTYKLRSCYSAALAVAYWMYESREFTKDQPLDWVRTQMAEYKSVRDYFSCDYYNLIEHGVDDSGWATSMGHAAPLVTADADDSSWTAWQYDRPEQYDGIVLAFRRKKSPYPLIHVSLQGINDQKTYLFKDADTKETFSVKGQDLIENGLDIWIHHMRESKLLFYCAE